MTDQIVQDGQPGGVEHEVMTFGDQTLERIAAEAPAKAEAMTQIMLAAMSMTNHRDWVNQGGKPYMCASGAEKVARIGVTVSNITRSKIQDEDEKGRYYIWEYAGTFSIAGRTLEAVGTCSSRDKFFAVRNGELLPAGDIDQTNIMKAAYSNLLVNGITRLLGLRSVTFEDLEAIGIELDKIEKVEYGKGTEGGSSDEDKILQRHVAEMCMALANGDKKKAGDILEGLTEFKGDDDKMISRRTAKSLKGKWLRSTYGKAQREFKDLFGHDFGSEPENENQDPDDQSGGPSYEEAFEEDQ